jgi:uncharacterized membrane protein YozB (DUF420 family)
MGTVLSILVLLTLVYAYVLICWTWSSFLTRHDRANRKTVMTFMILCTPVLGWLCYTVLKDD